MQIKSLVSKTLLGTYHYYIMTYTILPQSMRLEE